MSIHPIVANPYDRIARANRVAAATSGQALGHIAVMRSSLDDIQSDLARIGEALDDMSARIGTSLSNYDDLRACLDAADAAHADGGIPALEAARDRLQAWIRATR
jgi:hypothetical protein